MDDRSPQDPLQILRSALTPAHAAALEAALGELALRGGAIAILPEGSSAFAVEIPPSPPALSPPPPPLPYTRDPRAVVDEGAEVGEGTRIWHFSHVQSGARIGRGCNLGQNVNVDRDVVIGDHVKIQNNVSIYKGVVIEDYAFLGPSCVFTNVINPRSHVPRRDAFRETRVGKGASVGANATLVCGVTVGAYALIGAGAVVTRDVPAYALMVGVPARQKGWVCHCGEGLPGDALSRGEAQCAECGSRYRLSDAGETLDELERKGG